MNNNQTGYFESTETESEKDILELFPNIPSEDVSNLLIAPTGDSVDLNNLEEKTIEPSKIEKYNQSIELTLGAPGEGFDGKKIFDVMYSLGLKWGDMDIFHWENKSEIGDDFHFNVWTTTEPGYFIPEDIIKNNSKFRNLVFGFFIPRTYKPQEVLDSMIKAIEYANSKLDGVILYNGATISDDYQEIKKIVSDIEKNMTEDGVKPGSNNALLQF